MTDLKSLIAELEQAKEGSNELDRQIHAFVDGSPLEGSCDKCKQTFIRFPRSYTVNLDDALKLVPEGWGWAAAELDEGEPSAVTTNREPQIIPGTLDSNPNKIDFRTKAATPAIALCIASLRAREAEND